MGALGGGGLEEKRKVGPRSGIVRFLFFIECNRRYKAFFYILYDVVLILLLITLHLYPTLAH